MRPPEDAYYGVVDSLCKCILSHDSNVLSVVLQLEEAIHNEMGMELSMRFKLPMLLSLHVKIQGQHAAN